MTARLLLLLVLIQTAVNSPSSTQGTQVNGAYSSQSANAAAGNGELVIPYSGTMTLNPNYLTNITTLTGDTQVYAPAGSGGEKLTATFCQDAAGSHRITSTNIRGMFSIGMLPGKCNSQTYAYSPNQGAWLSNSTGVINQ